MAAEEEYLKDTLGSILQAEIVELQAGLEKAREEAREAALEFDDGLVHEVSVIFETEEVVFRVNDMYNFEALKDDSCRYFEVPARRRCPTCSATPHCCLGRRRCIRST